MCHQKTVSSTREGGREQGNRPQLVSPPQMGRVYPLSEPATPCSFSGHGPVGAPVGEFGGSLGSSSLPAVAPHSPALTSFCVDVCVILASVRVRADGIQRNSHSVAPFTQGSA